MQQINYKKWVNSVIGLPLIKNKTGLHHMVFIWYQPPVVSLTLTLSLIISLPLW